jgi:hypothetical protein
VIRRLPVPMLGGVNLWADPTQIRDDQLAYAKNLMPVEPGVVGTRPAMKWARSVLLNPLLAPYIPVRAAFSPVGPNFAIILHVNGQTLLVGIDENNTNSLVLGTSDAPIPASLVQWDGDTYAFTGQSPGARLAFAVNAAGYVLEALNFGTGNGDFKPTGAAVIRDRFAYWGFEAGDGGRSVLFADRGFPLQIGSSAVASGRALPVAGISQTPITHCAEINTQSTGSPNQSVVAVWTRDNMWMLLGEPGETGDGLTPESILGTLQQNLLPVAAGCVSGATVVQTPYGTLWTGPDDVWFMPFGSLPIRVGTNIRPALEATPPAVQWKWHAEYDSSKGHYRLALFGPGTGPTEFSGCDHHWILDLSQGPPRNADEARWFGPQEYKQSVSDSRFNGTHCLLRDIGANGDRSLYGMSWASESVGGGSVSGLFLTLLDADDSIDTVAPMLDRVPRAAASEYFLGDEIVPYDEAAGETRPYVWTVTTAGITDAGASPLFNDGSISTRVDGGVTWDPKETAGLSPAVMFIPRSWYPEANGIRAELLTKEYALGDPMVDKLIDGSELGYWTDKTNRLSYRFLTDVSERTRVIQAPADQLGIAGFENIVNPKPPVIRGQRIWKTRLLPATGSRRSVAKTIQLRIVQDNVFIVDDSNDRIVVGESSGAPGVAQVARGEYTYLALLEAVASALENFFGAGWSFVTPTIGLGSLEGLAVTGSTNDFQIYFQRVGPVTSAVTDDDLQKCARLFQLFGFDPNNAPDWGTGIGSGFITIQGDTTEPFTFTFGRVSTYKLNSSRIQLSGLNVRVRPFGRRPM